MTNFSSSKYVKTKAVRLLSWLLVFSLIVLVLDLPKPRQAAHAVNKMLIFWAGGAAPTGWTIDTTFDDRMIRGAASYSAAGSTLDTHIHSISWVSSAISEIFPVFSEAGSGVADERHEHNSLGPTTMDTGSHLPPYRTLKIISCDAGTSCTVPDDGIAIFDAAPTSGTWTRYSAQDDKFIRGSGTVGSTGGATTHTHTNTSITTSSPSNSVVGTGSEPVNGPTGSHTHTGSGTTASGDHTPPNVDVLLYQNTLGSAQAVPAGMIAMFNGAPGTGWDTISDGGETFYEKWMEAKSSYSASGGGATTHTHSDLGIVTGTTGSTAAVDRFLSDMALTPDESLTHTHTITVSFGNANNSPNSVDVIIAQKLTYTPDSRNWWWFDSEDTATPDESTVGGETTIGDAMAAENTAPGGTRVVYKLNAMKLRVVAGETAGAAGTTVKFRLQYDTTTDFSSPTVVGTQASTSQLFRYYDGDGVDDDDTVTLIPLTGSPTAGRHNEDATTGIGQGSTLNPAASTIYEHEFTIQNYNGAADTVYYFRLQYAENSDGTPVWGPVSLNGSYTYPSVRTSAAYDLETYQVAATVSLGNYTKGDGGTLQYIFQAGEEVVIWDKRGSAPGVTVTVNSYSMTCASPSDTIPGTDITWTSAAGSLNGSFASDPTGSTGNDGQTLDANRTAYSLGSSADKTVRTGGFYFLPTLDLANLDSRSACNYTNNITVTIA